MFVPLRNIGSFSNLLVLPPYPWCPACSPVSFTVSPSPMIVEKPASITLITDTLGGPGKAVRVSKDPTCDNPVVGAEDIPWISGVLVSFTPREVAPIAFICTLSGDSVFSALPGFTSITSSCLDQTINGQEDSLDCGGPSCVKCSPTAHPLLPPTGPLFGYIAGTMSPEIYYVPSKNPAAQNEDVTLSFSPRALRKHTIQQVQSDVAVRLATDHLCTAVVGQLDVLLPGTISNAVLRPTTSAHPVYVCISIGDGPFEPIPTIVPNFSVQNTCTDRVKNGDEGEVDCGGSCGPCVRFTPLHGQGSSTVTETSPAYVGEAVTIVLSGVDPGPFRWLKLSSLADCADLISQTTANWESGESVILSTE
eukprot:gene4092-4427_t